MTDVGYLVFSCSLNPGSRSFILARRVTEFLREKGVEAGLVDLRELDLPACDGDACYDDPKVEQLRAQIERAQGALIAKPIYNYDASASAKNLIELTGAAWTKKVVGFLCAAGGENSYMAVMGLANSLMLDFRCIVVPRFVYASGAAFTNGRLSEPKIEGRVTELARELHRIASALS